MKHPKLTKAQQARIKKLQQEIYDIRGKYSKELAEYYTYKILKSKHNTFIAKNNESRACVVIGFRDEYVKIIEVDGGSIEEYEQYLPGFFDVYDPCEPQSALNALSTLDDLANTFRDYVK